MIPFENEAYLLFRRYIFPCESKRIEECLEKHYKKLKELTKQYNFPEINEILIHAYFFTTSQAYLAKISKIRIKDIENQYPVNVVVTATQQIENVSNPHNLIIKEGKNVIISNNHIVDNNPPTYVLRFHNTKNIEEWIRFFINIAPSKSSLSYKLLPTHNLTFGNIP